MAVLLTYAAGTTPAVLQASPPDAVETATLTILATNNSGSNVTLAGIEIQVPVGSNATQLTNDPAQISCNLPSGWTANIPNQSQPGIYGLVFDAPGNSVSIPNQSSLVFILEDIPVNSSQGSVTITVIEGSTGSPSVALPPVNKFPSGWGTITFTASQENVSYGGSTVLSWNGPSGPDYELQYLVDGNVLQQSLDNSGIYPGQGQPDLTLNQTTTFTLVVTDIIDGSTYTATPQLTITVTTSDISANSLDVDNDASIGGTLAVLQDATIGGNISISGEISAPSLAVSQNATVSGSISAGTLNASGNITSPSLVISQNIAVAGNVDAGALTVSGNTLFNGNVYAGELVGINNTTPQYNLDIDGALQVTNSSSTTDGSSYLKVADISNPSFTSVNSDYLTTVSVFNGAVGGTGLSAGASYGATALVVNGKAVSTSSSVFAIPADVSVMQDTKPFTEGLAQVLQINPVTFYYTEHSGYGTETKHTGIIAQQLQEIAPAMVSEQQEGDKASVLHVNNHNLVYMLLNAVKELKAEIELLKTQVNEKQ